MRYEAGKDDHADRKILASILDIGETLLSNGAEVMRVEDTVSRLCEAYGFTRADVFTVTTSIFLTASTPCGSTVTQIRRVPSAEKGTDLDKVARANELSRDLCSNPVDLMELRSRVACLKNGPEYPQWLKLMLSGTEAAVFAIFFGGTLLDAFAAAITGVFVSVGLNLGKVLRINSIILSAILSGVAGAFVMGLCLLGIGRNPDKIMIGNIMLLIPGLALTTSLRDMISGDTLSGLMGFCEATLKAAAVAGGSAMMVHLLGGGIR